MHVVACLLAALAQEEWDRPLELDRGGRFYPLALRIDGSRRVLASVEVVEGNDAALSTYEFAKDTWRRTGRAPVKLTAFPALLLRSNDCLLSVMPENDTLDLYSCSEGRLRKIAPLRSEGLETMEDDEIPSLVEHRGALFFLSSGEERPNRVHLLKSADGGANWTDVADPAWTLSRHRGGRALAFEYAEELQVVFATDECRQVVHASSADGGKTWRRRDTRFPGDEKSMPVACASTGKSACIVYVTGEDAGKKGTVRSILSTDAGKTWRAGGILFDSYILGWEGLSMLSMAGDSVAYVGMRFESSERQDRKVMAVLSRDGGVSWKDLGVTEHLARETVHGAGALSADGKEFFVALHNHGPDGSDGRLLFRRWGPPAGPKDRPLSREEGTRLADVISRLMDDDLEVREKAMAEIESFGDRAVPPLRKCLESTRDRDRRRWLEAALDRLIPVWWNDGR